MSKAAAVPEHTGETWPPPRSLPGGRAAGIHMGKNRDVIRVTVRKPRKSKGKKKKQAKEQKRRNGKGWGWVRVAVGRIVVYLDGVKERSQQREERKQKRIRERRTERERWKEVEQRNRRRETRTVRRRGRHWRKMAQAEEKEQLGD